MTKSNLTYTFSQENEAIAVFHLSGKILAKQDTEELEETIGELLSKSEEVQLIFSLKNLDFINSTGLNFIISTFTKARNQGSELIICEVSQKIQELLIVTKLHTIFTSFDTLGEAIQSIDSKLLKQ